MTMSIQCLSLIHMFCSPAFAIFLGRHPKLHPWYFLTDYLSIKHCSSKTFFPLTLRYPINDVCIFACVSFYMPVDLVSAKHCQPPGVQNNKSPRLSCQPSMNHYYVISISSQAGEQAFLWTIRGWVLGAKAGNFPVHYVTWVFASLSSMGVFTSTVLAWILLPGLSELL